MRLLLRLLSCVAVSKVTVELGRGEWEERMTKIPQKYGVLADIWPFLV